MVKNFKCQKLEKNEHFRANTLLYNLLHFTIFPIFLIFYLNETDHVILCDQFSPVG